ncbi:MAG: hypothetical protein ACKO7P_13060 [Bacteroidota bacterium]
MRTKKNNSPKENAPVKKPSTKGTTETKKTVTTRDKRKYRDFKIKDEINRKLKKICSKTGSFQWQLYTKQVIQKKITWKSIENY